MYAVYHGPEGLRAIAERVHGQAAWLAASLGDAGIEVYADFFDTLAVRAPGGADEVLAAALRHGVNLRRLDDDHVGIALDETTTEDVLERVRSEEHTSELQSLMRTSYAVFCLKKKTHTTQ